MYKFTICTTPLFFVFIADKALRFGLVILLWLQGYVVQSQSITQSQIESESILYENLGLDKIQVKILIRDAEIDEWVEAKLTILEENKVLLQNQIATKGIYAIQLPLLRKYSFNFHHERFADTTIIADFTQINRYDSTWQVYLKPRKVNLQISIRDIDNDEPVSLGGTLNNQNRNEQIVLLPKDSYKGTYRVKVRENDEYEMEVKSPSGYVFYTHNRIIPKESNDKKLNVKIAQVLKINSKIPLGNTNFAYKSAELNQQAIKELDRILILLKDYPTAHLEIGAHTDSFGTDSDNFKLSIQRANSVQDYLIQHGIQPSRLKTKGYGATKPIAENYTEEGRAKNRRFELLVLSL